MAVGRLIVFERGFVIVGRHWREEKALFLPRGQPLVDSWNHLGLLVLFRSERSTDSIYLYTHSVVCTSPKTPYVLCGSSSAFRRRWCFGFCCCDFFSQLLGCSVFLYHFLSSVDPWQLCPGVKLLAAPCSLRCPHATNARKPEGGAHTRAHTNTTPSEYPLLPPVFRSPCPPPAGTTLVCGGPRLDSVRELA